MFDFCGIGNACVDIVANVDDAFLSAWNYPKGICTYLELDEADRLEKALPAPAYIPGGCAANTAAMIALLGGSAAFMGRVSDDPVGRLFMDDLKARGIHYVCTPESAGAGSTRVYTLVTPDTERTFATYYGVQEDLSEADLDAPAIESSKFMYLDGYALNSRRGAEAFLEAAHISKRAGQSVVLAPNDISILDKYGSAIAALEAQSDILLCSSQEAYHMTGTTNTQTAIKALQKRFSIGAVTVGADGAYVFDKDNIHHVPAATPPAAILDANGAGDAFAGGFLYGLARGWPMENAAALGNRCAAAIITHAGARPLHACKDYLAA